MDRPRLPAPNPTRPHSTTDPPDPPDPSPGGLQSANPITLALALVAVTLAGSLAVGHALGRPLTPAGYSVTCPDGSTYRATYAKPTEGMLEIRGMSGRRVVLPGTCKAVQE